MPLRIPRPATASTATGLALGLLLMSGTTAEAGNVRSAEWWLRTLSVTRAWDTTQGTGVTVAVLDTGVDASQPDLSGSVITGPDYVPTGQPAAGQPFAVHGTEMASLIAGHGHGPGGRAGIIGIAPKARILSVRVTPDPGDSQLSDPAVAAALPDAIAAGIRYATNNGAQVIDLPMDPSIPGAASPEGAVPPAPSPATSPSPAPTPSASPPGSGGSAAERAAVAYALARGVVLVAPAGDNYLTGDAPNYPAAYPGVIAVGAFSRQFLKASYSSRQPYVTVTAAGSGVLAATPTGYQRISSTSAASAVVAGIVALIKSVYPYLTPAQVTEALTRSTVYHPVGPAARGSGHGTVDAARALAEAAIIATPGAARAGAHAQPRRLPPLPAAAANPRLAPRLIRDGLLAAALLAVLLLLIWAYAAARRRRRPAAGPWEEPGDALVRYVPPMTATASRMLEAFSAPVLPAPPGGQAYPRAVPAAAAGQPAPAVRALPPAGPGGLAPGVSRAGQARPALGTARQVPPAAPPTARPAVSGSPPWEPAAKPEGEVPWASTPAPLSLAGRAALQPRPVVPRDPLRSVHAARQAAGPGREGGQPALAPAGPAPGGSGAPKAWQPERPPAADAGESSELALPQVPRMARPSPDARHAPGQVLADHAESRPIYVWNPGAATETFPVVPADDAMSPDD